MGAAAAMPSGAMYHCHRCNKLVQVSELMECLQCGSGFVEEAATVEVDQRLQNVTYHRDAVVRLLRELQTNLAEMSELMQAANSSISKRAPSWVLDVLTEQPYKEEECINSDCVICTTEFEPNENVVLLDCKHLFHRACVGEWFDHASCCPICRTELNLVELSQKRPDAPQLSPRPGGDRLNVVRELRIRLQQRHRDRTAAQVSRSDRVDGDT